MVATGVSSESSYSNLNGYCSPSSAIENIVHVLGPDMECTGKVYVVNSDQDGATAVSLQLSKGNVKVQALGVGAKLSLPHYWGKIQMN